METHRATSRADYQNRLSLLFSVFTADFGGAYNTYSVVKPPRESITFVAHNGSRRVQLVFEGEGGGVRFWNPVAP